MGRLDRVKDQLRTQPTFLLRQLLSQLIFSAVADLETKAVEIQLALPSYGRLGHP